MSIVILGATGTLGQALVKRLLATTDERLICVSRDELKQKMMDAQFKSNRLRFRIGDIKDRDAMFGILSPSIKAVFHVAALKHIDTIEDNPEESVKTNVLGTINVADAVERSSIPNMVFSSTDKAVDPVNVYGMSKGISERILQRRNERGSPTLFSVYRWGNVVGSRGSAITQFANSLKNESRVLMTHVAMTRFWIRIEDAVDFMLKTYREPSDGVRIPPMKCAPVSRVIQKTADILGVKNYSVETIGVRKGEKIHEAMTSKHGPAHINSADSDQFTDEELTDLLRPIILEGNA